MSGIQFRRYELKSGAHDDFLTWYHHIVPISERCGFQLLFALDLPESDEFVSAWAFTGDLDEIEHRYYTDSDRTQFGRLARDWAERQASDLAEDARRAEIDAHPGFTRATHITSARLRRRALAVKRPG